MSVLERAVIVGGIHRRADRDGAERHEDAGGRDEPCGRHPFALVRARARCRRRIRCGVGCGADRVGDHLARLVCGDRNETRHGGPFSLYGHEVHPWQYDVELTHGDRRVVDEGETPVAANDDRSRTMCEALLGDRNGVSERGVLRPACGTPDQLDPEHSVVGERHGLDGCAKRHRVGHERIGRRKLASRTRVVPLRVRGRATGVGVVRTGEAAAVGVGRACACRVRQEDEEHGDSEARTRRTAAGPPHAREASTSSPPLYPLPNSALRE